MLDSGNLRAFSLHFDDNSYERSVVSSGRVFAGTEAPRGLEIEGWRGSLDFSASYSLKVRGKDKALSVNVFGSNTQG